MKCGLKTIPLPVDDRDELKLVETEFGVKGWATVIKLWQYIAKHGFYLQWDIDTQFLFIRECQLQTVGQNCVSEVVACCLRRGVFDQGLYQKYGILTSKWLQETFLNATKRSNKVIIDARYALPVVYEFIQNVNKGGKNANIYFKNADISDTKEKKGNESNVKESQERKVAQGAPDKKTVSDFFKTRGYKSNADKFYNYYAAQGWQLGGNPVRNWHALAELWESRESDFGKNEQGNVRYSPDELDSLLVKLTDDED